MEQESRAQIGKELSKIYFDRSHSDFNQQEYFYALSEEIRIVDTIGDIRFKADGTVHEREQKWRHGIKDIEIIIQKSIAHSKHIEWRNKILIPTAHILETNLNGKNFYPVEIGPLPVPEHELPGQLFFSNTHYIQVIKIDDQRHNYYLRDTQNKYFFRTLYVTKYKYDLPESKEVIDYLTLGRMEQGNMIVVGINTSNKWQLSLLKSDDQFEINKMMDTGKIIFNSAVDINIEKVQEEANLSLKRKVIKDLEKRGFIIKNNDLFESLGGNPNALSDSEFEMVFGVSRD